MHWINCSYMWIFFFRDVFGLVPSSNGEKMCISTSSPVTKLKRGTGLQTYKILSFIVIIITIIIIIVIITIFHLRTKADWFYNYLNVKPSALIKWIIIIVKMIAPGCQKKEDCSRDKQRATKAEVTIVSFLYTWSFFWLLALFVDHQYHINREKSRKPPLPRWLFLACAFHNLTAATQKPKTLQITASNTKRDILCCHW